jgi:molybdate transport system substrate-binding protein
MSMPRRALASLAIALAAGGLVACGGGGASQPDGSGETIRGDVTVYAAASLTEAFTEIATAFEEEYPEAHVVFNFGGTPILRTQLEQGARADVFASANVEQMELARASGVVEASASTFARNSLVIVTPSGVLDAQ